MKHSKTERKGKENFSSFARALAGAWPVLMLFSIHVSPGLILSVLCISYCLIVCITRANKRRLKRVT